MKKVINVLECGADPTGTHDCTQAFRDALAHADALGVLVPHGTYKISGLIKGDPAEAFKESGSVVKEKRSDAHTDRKTEDEDRTAEG